MDALARHIRKPARILAEAALEAAWPTRCALCDRPGYLICGDCRARLPYVDQNLTCSKCGAPFGFWQCTECNEMTLKASRLNRLPLDGCVSLLRFDEQAKAIITTYKDRGELRLAQEMAVLLTGVCHPRWPAELEAVSYIPSTVQALRRRGYDHAEILARHVSEQLGLPCRGLLTRPKTYDQRALGRKERSLNMAGAFRVNPAALGKMPESVLLVDDVMTTGATLYAASAALRKGGARRIQGMTFARV